MSALKSRIITVDGRRGKEKELAIKTERLRKMVAERPSRDARSCGNGCFGHAMAGEVSRQEDMLRKDITDLTELLKTSIDAAVPDHRKYVCIGHTITLERREGPSRNRVTERHRIVGDGEGDCTAIPPKLAYNSGLAKLFMSESVGYSAAHWRGGKEIIFRLTNIQISR